MSTSASILGHRGGRGDGWPPENTIDAFTRAFAEGADGLELDVRLSASGEAVVLHDATLEHVTHGADKRPLHAVTTRDLPLLEGGRRIPTLEEALEASAGRIVNVELKADFMLRVGKRAFRISAPLPRRLALVREVVRVVDRASHATEIVFSSFDPVVVLALAALAPRHPRAMLVGPSTPRLAVALPLTLRRTIVAAHLENDLVNEARAQRLRRAGLRVVAWTVNDAERAKHLADLGVEWVITDNPRVIVERLRPRR